MPRVHFILGCTAGGKGALGRELARRVGAHIISVDSMKIYRRMDIGTAKPAPADRAEIPHHCIDIAEPSESFSAARYVTHADRAIEQIASASSPVLVVGATSLYIKALSEGLFEGPPADADLRRRLEARAATEGLAALHAELARFDPAAAERIHRNDRRRIVRAIEVYQTTGRPISELQKQWDTGHRRHECVFVGLRRQKEDRSGRINARVKCMIEVGLRDEAAALLAEPAGLSPQGAAAVGYAEMFAHLRGEMGLDKTVERIKISTRRLAKKQQTWYRRWRDVIWFDVAADETPVHLADRVQAAVDFQAP